MNLQSIRVLGFLQQINYVMLVHSNESLIVLIHLLVKHESTEETQCELLPEG